MLESGVSPEALKEAAIAKLEALADTSELFEIRHAAHYIAVNVSNRTSKTALHELRKQLSKLLANIQDQKDYTFFDNAFNELMWALPELPKGSSPVSSELVSRSSILMSYGTGTGTGSSSSGMQEAAISSTEIDDLSPLLGQAQGLPKKRSGWFSKKR